MWLTPNHHFLISDSSHNVALLFTHFAKTHSIRSLPSLPSIRSLRSPIGMYGYNIFDTDYIVARCIYDKIKYIKDFDKKN